MEAFAAAHGASVGTADRDGVHTLDVPVRSTVVRGAAAGQPPWRSGQCEGEPAHDRYQRATVDNVTTGESWSADIENPWPGGAGDGSGRVEGVRARRGDELRLRFNLRALGHVALLGSGITIVDLNRSYRLPHPPPTPQQRAGGGQCGRRLGKYEGQSVVFPEACAPALGGIGMTTALATAGIGGLIDVYSPLHLVGALHVQSTLDRPGGVESDAVGTVGDREALQFEDLAACIVEVEGERVLLRDIALFEDRLFLSLGNAGIYVYDVADRSLRHLAGRLSVPGHSVYRLQVDTHRELLFAGGKDERGESIIDIWSLRDRVEDDPAPIATLRAEWSTNQLGLDDSGSGVVFTWDRERGPLAVPFDRARIGFVGIGGERLVPLGVPRGDDDEATAAFKLRAALPGSLGNELQVRVQSLRAPSGEKMLGTDGVGAAVLPGGGAAWPESEVRVLLRRLGTVGLANSYSLYESVETVLLIADPRARAGYLLRDEPGTEADERGQCRNCERPTEPAGEIQELLAGRWIRAFLSGDGHGPTESAIAFFEAQGDNYPLPTGLVEVATGVAGVSSPAQTGVD
jgi:hypothetical protein